MPLYRHRLRPAYACNKARRKAQIERKIEREKDEKREENRTDPGLVVGRLGYCDANVSNRPSQPTICPFARGTPTLHCTERYTLNLPINHYCTLMMIVDTLT